MKFLLGLRFHNDATNAARTLEAVKKFHTGHPSVLICLMDDASTDDTADKIHLFLKENPLPRVSSLRNNRAFGHGGNQKVLYRLAIDDGFDAVALLRAARPESLDGAHALLSKVESEADADAVLGLTDRMRGLAALFLGPADMLQNRWAGKKLCGWHSAYRAFHTRALKDIAFELNTNGPHFDTEILLQLIDAKKKIVETRAAAFRPDAWFTGGWIGLKNGLKASLKYKLQKFNLFYDVRYYPDTVKNEPEPHASVEVYGEKFDSRSPHSIVLGDDQLVPAGARVLDIGCSSGYVARELARRKNCKVTGVDILPPESVDPSLSGYHRIDLESEYAPLNDLVQRNGFDVILLLDVLEHLSNPENFLLNLSRQPAQTPPVVLMSTGNVAFIAVRLMLLFGFFNYGRRGILDVTHKRLFSLRTFRNMTEQTGLLVIDRRFFPFPFRALGFPSGIAGLLEKINMALIKISPSLFAYQFMFKTTPITTPLMSLLPDKKASVVSANA